MHANTPEIPPVSPEFYRALKASIARFGVLVPLFFNHQSKCLDGLVRLRICEELGITKYPSVTVHADRTEGEDLRVTLNGLRRHLNQAQMREVIRWTLIRYPQESNRKIAERTGASDKTVGKYRGAECPQLKRKGKDGKNYPAKKTPAVFAHTPAARKEAARALDQVGDQLDGGYQPLRKVRKTYTRHQREEIYKNAGATLPEHFDLRCGDFREVMPEVPDGTVDLVYGDPPWHQREFPREEYAAEVYRLLRPGGILACYVGSNTLVQWARVLEDAGLTYRWLVSGINCASASDPRPTGGGAIKASAGNSAIMNLQRAILLLSKGRGPFRTASILRDVLWTETRERDLFEWQQPVSEAAELVRTLCPVDGLVCDLTFGTGTSAVAVARCGQGRRFVGAEVHAGRVRMAESRVAEALGITTPVAGPRP